MTKRGRDFWVRSVAFLWFPVGLWAGMHPGIGWWMLGTVIIPLLMMHFQAQETE
jgi:hypothetical protein